MPRAIGRATLRLAALVAAYVVTARLGLLVGAVEGLATLVWPPSGIALAMLLLFGRRVWPGILLGALVANLWAGAAIPVAVGIAVGNTLEGLTGAWVLRRIPGFDPSLCRVGDVVALLVAAGLLSTMISATVGVASLHLAGITTGAKLDMWRIWWLGDLVGDLTFAPLIMVWATGPHPHVTLRRALEIAAIVLALVVATLLFEGIPEGLVAPVGHAYFFFPPLVWAVLRFGQRGAVTATLLVKAIAIWGTATGHGPFVRPALHDSLFALQVFMAVQGGTFLLLGAAISERGRALEDVTGARADLERKILDLTEMRRGEEKLRRLLSAAPDAMVIVKKNGIIAIVNGQLLKAFGYAEGELEGQPIEVLIPERFRERHVGERLGYVAAPRARPMGAGLELFGRRKDGTEFPVEVSLGPMESDEGLLITAAIRDLTERRAAEERLRASLAEKEVLLKEVHHRVKNSLQVISSLLSLQARRAEDPSWQVAFSESQSRVRSIALVHELLYRSPDLSSIPFQDYVQRLCRTLLGMYLGRGSDVTLEVSAERIHLTIDSAIPCGLIINELVTNSLRHAFPGGRSGHVWVAVHPEDGRMILEVGDDGVGFPPGTDFRQTRSVGLQLVARLVDQLQGSIERVETAGARFRIAFAPGARQPSPS